MLTQADHDHLNCPACGGSGHIEDATYAAVRNLLAERRRCISVEGWTPEHDDEHGPAILAEAAGCYAYWSADGERLPNMVPHEWPLDDDWWKPGKQYRMLEKAGQLILAAMECLDRAAGATSGIAEAKTAATPQAPQESAGVAPLTDEWVAQAVEALSAAHGALIKAAAGVVNLRTWGGAMTAHESGQCDEALRLLAIGIAESPAIAKVKAALAAAKDKP
jgi:hypothetical protein